MTKPFAKFAKREQIAHADWARSIRLAGAGAIDADLGGGVIRQRIARQGEGKSGGYRTLIAFRSGVRAVYMYEFPKNERTNITKRELAALRLLAADLLGADETKFKLSIEDGSLIEIT